MKDNFNHNKRYLEYLYSIPKEVYIKILENCFSDIYVTDKNRKILYANPNSLRHYGVSPGDMVGKDSESFSKGKWTPSALDLCMNEKRTVFVEQNYLLIGKKISSVLTPVVDENGEIEMIVAVASEPPVSYDLTWREVDFERSNQLGINYDNTNDKKDEIIAQSDIFCKILTTLRKVAKSDASILLTGESGVGKTLIAEYVHKISSRADKAFWAINCTVIPENLLESELFGYAPYAFTGASNKGKIGLIELADGGTLFLDEIGDLAPSLQAKLLDVLENKRFIPVGGNSMKYVNIRIVAATNSNLEKLVAEKRFRSDLYWRINIINIEIPSLSDRREDILPLTSYFLKKYNEQYGKKVEFSPKVIAVFLFYGWPGNIRQLKNVIERTVLLSDNGLVSAEHLPTLMTEGIIAMEESSEESYDYILENIGKCLIRESYKRNKNMKKVANDLGISHSKAFRLVSQYCQDIK